METLAGTANFVSKWDAIQYYKNQECDRTEVERKIKDSEIFIGPPSTLPGDTWFIKEGRYHVREMNFAELRFMTRYVADDAGMFTDLNENQYAIVRMAGADDFSNRSVFAAFDLPRRGLVVIAIHSYLDAYLTDEEALDIATDIIHEKWSDEITPRILRG
tara:strand:- start:56739 stop:57218 length:480 start_codon:yes stop_codon:yes gene_type:complete